MLLTRFACSDGETWLTARDLSDSTGLPLPTVSKILKLFSRNGVLAAQRGVYGGYRLAHQAKDIRILDVIELVDGPIAITDCAGPNENDSTCSIKNNCPTRPHWIKVTEKIRAALSELTLQEMSSPVATASKGDFSDPGGNCGDRCGPVAGQPCQCGHDSLDFRGELR